MDQAKSFIRTMWPVVVGYLAGLLVTWAGHSMGVTIDSNVAFGIVTTVLVGIIYGGGRWLETRRSPFAQHLGRVLLSFGLDLGQPTYKPAPPAADPPYFRA